MTKGLFDRRWVALAVAVVALGVVLGEPPLILLSALILTLFPIARWWSRRVLRGVRYQRRFVPSRAFPGERLRLTVQIENRKLLPVPWLRVQDEFPRAVTPVGREGQSLLAPSHEQERGYLVSLLTLRWYERVRRQYMLRCARRGVFVVGPVRYQSGDLFSLFRTEEVRRQPQRVVVYPRLVPLEALDIPSKAPFGDTRAPRELFRDPSRIMGCRDHRPHDSFRHIHWKATARRGELQVKVYEPTVTLSVVLCLNVATFAHPWQGVRPEILERLVSATASLANYAIEQRWLVGLAANGTMRHADQPIRVPPGCGPDQLSSLLEALAGVTSFTTAPFERFLLDESRRMAWGATLVVVTAVLTDEIRASLARLRAAGRRLVLVALTPEPPEALPGVLTYFVPQEGLAFDPTEGGGKAHLVPVEP